MSAVWAWAAQNPVAVVFAICTVLLLGVRVYYKHFPNERQFAKLLIAVFGLYGVGALALGAGRPTTQSAILQGLAAFALAVYTVRPLLETLNEMKRRRDAIEAERARSAPLLLTQGTSLPSAAQSHAEPAPVRLGVEPATDDPSPPEKG